MQRELQTELSRLLEEAQHDVEQGKRENAYQASLKATRLAPDEPMAWYLRAQSAPSNEEHLICLSRAYSLDPLLKPARTELRSAVHRLLKQEPFLAYVHETEELYQVRSGLDLLINIPKNRAFEPPYLKKNPSLLKPAFTWLYLSLLALLLGGVGAVLFAPITAFQVLRIQSRPLYRADRVRLLVIMILSLLVWIVSIPISWLFLIRFFP
ncbi:MAG TPA: hypothetical protein VFY26_07100 [Anaerolineales bacterium]|nr:hypothetical protein [Anaerolineales bacterium]